MDLVSTSNLVCFFCTEVLVRITQVKVVKFLLMRSNYIAFIIAN